MPKYADPEEIVPARFIFMLAIPFIFIALVGIGLGIPMLTAVGGALGGGFALKSFEAKQQYNKAVAQRAVAKEIEANHTVYHCQNYENTTLELRLAEGGVMKYGEITTCDENLCQLCAPIRTKQKDLQYHAQALEQRKARELAEKERQSRRIDLTHKPRYNPAVPSARFYPSLDTKPTFWICKRCKQAVSQAVNDTCNDCRRAEAGGIQRPCAVPDYATYDTYYKHGEPAGVVWTWTDASTGYPQGYRQPMDFTTYMMQTAASRTSVRTWHEVRDPDTGVVLGSFSVDENGQTRIKSVKFGNPGYA